MNNKYLIFFLQEEYFALDVNRVLEVLPSQKITFVPNSEDFIEGVINYRGDIVTIIDTYKKFNLSRPENISEFDIIIIEYVYNKKNNATIGIIVEKVFYVTSIADSQINTNPEFGNVYNSEYIDGYCNTNLGFVKIINIDKTFDYKI